MNFIATTMVTLVLLTNALTHQDVPEVPNAVKNAFSQNFNNPADVAWVKTDNGYEVDFDLGNVEHAARYTPEGKLLMVKMALNERDLPPVILQRIVDGFREFEIDDIEQVKIADRLLFQVALNGPSEDRKVVFTPKGEIEESFPYWK